ncbi:MAG TPA: response regulator [Aggregatilineaceae bacterium]|nr:response regulator [Aggregatilineaceae bacterium]
MFNDYVYLYVEDDPLSREALTLVVKRIMKVDRMYVFENSVNFMARIKALPEKPDLILLDIHMAPLTGFEMLALLRRDAAYEKAKIVALTASVMNEEVELLKSSGFDGVIGKPISVQQFPTLIQQVIQGEAIWHVTEN